MKTLGIAIAIYALGTLLSGLALNVTEFGIARFIAGFGLGAEWFLGGTGVAEAFSGKDRAKWTGRFHSAWYAGFILAAAIVPFLAPVIGWREVFYIGIIPAGLLFYIRIKAQEPQLWSDKKKALGERLNMKLSIKTIFDSTHRRDTLILAAIMVPVITGLYGGTLFVPAALTSLHAITHATIGIPYLIAIGGSIISAFTLIFCLIMPSLAQKLGRKTTLAIFLVFMAIGLPLVFKLGLGGHNLPLFLVLLILLGIGGADFSVFSLWLPELYPTEGRAGGFAFVTAFGRFLGAGLTFAIGALNSHIGLDNSLSLTAIFFVIALLILPFAREKRTDEVPT